MKDKSTNPKVGKMSEKWMPACAAFVALLLPVVVRAQSPVSTFGFFQNANFTYVERIAEDVPLGDNADYHAAAIDVGDRSKPTFVDIDADGDMDLVVGGANGQLTHYRNTGSSSNAIFTFDSLLSGLDIGNEAAPAFGDLDGDGDMDLLIGCDDYKIYFYENIGTATNGSFALRTGTADPFNTYIGDANYWGNYTCPTITDVNGDGKMDVVVGDSQGRMRYFHNESSGTNLVFKWLDGDQNPFRDIDTASRLVPYAVDRNHNGVPEGFLFGNFPNDYPHVCARPFAGAFFFFEPDTFGQFLYPVYAIQEGEQYCAPALADLDGDGRLEMVLGGTTGRLFYFKPSGGSFVTWRDLNFDLATESAIAGPGDDPDGDGLPNLVEYSLGLLPKVPDEVSFPAPFFDNGGHFSQAIQIRDDDASLAVIADIGGAVPFSAATQVQPVMTDPDPDDGLKTLTFSDPVSKSEVPRRFLRLGFDTNP